jgi:hypothetical protein
MGPLNRHFTDNTIPITKIKRLILFRKMISVYCENHTKHINTPCEQNAEVLNVKADGSTVLGNVLKKVLSNTDSCNSKSYYYHDTHLNAKNLSCTCVALFHWCHASWTCAESFHKSRVEFDPRQARSEFSSSSIRITATGSSRRKLHCVLCEVIHTGRPSLYRLHSQRVVFRLQHLFALGHVNFSCEDSVPNP